MTQSDYLWPLPFLKKYPKIKFIDPLHWRNNWRVQGFHFYYKCRFSSNILLRKIRSTFITQEHKDNTNKNCSKCLRGFHIFLASEARKQGHGNRAYRRHQFFYQVKVVEYRSVFLSDAGEIPKTGKDARTEQTDTNWPRRRFERRFWRHFE